jgi:hypothetical protein
MTDNEKRFELTRPASLALHFVVRFNVQIKIICLSGHEDKGVALDVKPFDGMTVSCWATFNGCLFIS